MSRIVLGSQAITYAIRPSARSRRLRLWASPEAGFVVTVPLWRSFDSRRPAGAGRARPSTSLGIPSERSESRDSGFRHTPERGVAPQDIASVERFLRRHQRWVLRQAKWLTECGARIPKRWPYGPTLPYRGEEHAVVLERSERGTAVRRVPERTLLVRLERPGIEAARRLLKRWYLGEAGSRLTERLAVLGEAAGVGWRRVSVRDQRRRWGSCSATGCLSFNYRLVMAPPEVMDYVIVHELAHRRVLNHSERFWAIVASRCPGYREARDWLRSYGPSLVL